MGRVIWSVWMDRSEFDTHMKMFYNEFVGENLAVTIEPVANMIRNSFKREITGQKLVWTGYLKKSVKVEREAVSNDYVSFNIYPSARYAATVEKGAPHIANIDKLRKWVIDKLGAPPDRAQQIAYILFEKFKTVGAKPHPYFAPVVERVKDKVPKMIYYQIYRKMQKYGVEAALT